MCSHVSLNRVYTSPIRPPLTPVTPQLQAVICGSVAPEPIQILPILSFHSSATHGTPMQTQARRMSSTALTFPSSSSIAAVGTPVTRTRVGKYELGNTLGEGSFAKVKYATNLTSGESVAIKIIDRDRILRHKMVEGVSRPLNYLMIS